MPSKKPTNRNLMEQAITAMKMSVAERRYDNKVSPQVGAVILKSDGNIETAYRGELREGDHAEFTLLERKNRANNLEGSILFATLEPCAPGCRKHPKLSCSERIVNARIKEVWVGIEDPDPTVDRKGIKFLQEHGVTVHMFERDLQEEIRAANKDFIAQALERKATADRPTEKPVLSMLENPVLTTETRDLSEHVLDLYRTQVGISDPIGSDEFYRRLVQHGLLKAVGQNSVVPSGFGFLLFGKSPRDVMQQAGLLGTIHWPDGAEEVRDFDGPLVEVPGQVIQWLKDKLPNTINRSGAQRTEANDKFLELVREGVVNALVHRDYDIVGAKCQLVVTPNTITIKSPGDSVPPITLEQLQDFTAPMLSRNPLLHFVFARMELAEERGLGLKSMRTRASDAGLPLPKYSWDNPYLVLTLFRTPESAIQLVKRDTLGLLNPDEKATLQFITLRQAVSSSEVMAEMNFDERKSQRVLKKLVETGVIRRFGKGRATQYAAQIS